ncbi:calcium-binding protein [Herbaspirillum huttiense]|uniref:calcium-binding protein n=1 Tax=Herbaspirillum huttiense TaxID=863372 RepID=UPI003877C76D
MSTTTSQDQPKAASSLSDPVITRIDKRFVQIQTGSSTKIVFAPISPDIKLFDPPEKPAATPLATKPPAIASKPVVKPPVASPTKPAPAKPSPIQTPVNVKPDIAPAPIAGKPASNKSGSLDTPASLQKPVTPDKSISLDKPVSPAKPAVTPTLAPVSPPPVVIPPSAHANPPAAVSSKPAPAAPAPAPLQIPAPSNLKPTTPEKLPAPTTMPAQRDKIDGKDVLVYGNPKSYQDLDYTQGDAVPGYQGTCTETSIANLLTIAGREVSEKDVVQRAIDNGWCDTNSSDPHLRGGTLSGQQRQLLESFGMPVETMTNYDPNKLAALIKEGKGVLIGVNNYQLWGANPNKALLDLINVNHMVNLTGAVYAADTGALQGFYIVDTGRGWPSDAARYVSLSELDKAAHFQFGCSVFYTVNAIKKLALPDDPRMADPAKPQHQQITGPDVLTYGNPFALFHDLDNYQGDAVARYEGTSGEVCIANLATIAGMSVTEKDVVNKAIAEKLCDTTSKDPEKRGSISVDNQLVLLKEFGLASTLAQGFDENAVARDIIKGKGVIVSVNGSRIWAKNIPKNVGMTDHMIAIIGVGYGAQSGEVDGFYITDSGRGLAADTCRYVSLQTMRDCTNASGCVTITTNEAIKPFNRANGTAGTALDQAAADGKLPPQTGLTAPAKPAASGGNALAAHYLDSFTAPAPFGDDEGSQHKLPGVKVRKHIALASDKQDLALDADNLDVTGNTQDNRLTGNDRNNVLDGLGGADTMLGGKGDDSYYVDNAGDRVVEHAGEGIDTVYATASTTLSANVENLVLLDATKPQSAVVNGVQVLVYGMPKSYQLDYDQGDAVPDFLGTCGETVVANMSVLAGRPLTEKEVVTRAIDEMLCDVIAPLPEHRGGTYTEGQRALLKDFGIDATITHGFDEMAVARSIKEGKAVGLSVNASRLWDMPMASNNRSNHCITVTGVAYAVDTEQIAGFYIADSGRGRADDMSRYVTLRQLRYATDVTSADTLTTDQAVKLWGQNLNATGNDLDNIVAGNGGANVLTGGKGNDLLIGGTGNDSYRFAKGDGQDAVYDHDATKGNVDTLSFTDARQDNLWFSKAGQDLRIKVLGTTDQVTVKDWYAGAAGTTDNHIERIKTADGKSLLDTDVEKLVQAMASFAPPAATQTTWAQAQGGDGKVLLAVSH